MTETVSTIQWSLEVSLNGVELTDMLDAPEFYETEPPEPATSPPPEPSPPAKSASKRASLVAKAKTRVRRGSGAEKPAAEPELPPCAYVCVHWADEALSALPPLRASDTVAIQLWAATGGAARVACGAFGATLPGTLPTEAPTAGGRRGSAGGGRRGSDSGATSPKGDGEPLAPPADGTMRLSQALDGGGWRLSGVDDDGRRQLLDLEPPRAGGAKGSLAARCRSIELRVPVPLLCAACGLGADGARAHQPASEAVAEEADDPDMLVRDLDTGAMISADSMVLNRDTGEMFTPSQLASRVPKALDPHMLRAPPALARAPRVVSLSIDGAAVVGETLRAHVTLDGATSHRLTWRRLWRDGETPPDGGGGGGGGEAAAARGRAARFPPNVEKCVRRNQ